VAPAPPISPAWTRNCSLKFLLLVGAHNKTNAATPVITANATKPASRIVITGHGAAGSVGSVRAVVPGVVEEAVAAVPTTKDNGPLIGCPSADTTAR
jgi:hypothetical protein